MKLWMLFSVPLLLISCATPYQKAGAMGGFEETQLGPTLYRITFTGNGYTSNSRNRDFALLRAAELGQQGAMPFFTVASDDASRPVTNVVGGAFSASMITKPENDMLVQYYKKRPASGLVYEVPFVMKSIKAKYKLD